MNVYFHFSRIKVQEYDYTLSEVAQSCPTLCDPTDCSLPGSLVHRIFQARVLEWVAISFSRDRTRVSPIVGRRFYHLSYQESHVKLCLIFKRNWETSWVAASFHIPISNLWESQCLHILASIGYCQWFVWFFFLAILIGVQLKKKRWIVNSIFGTVDTLMSSPKWTQFSTHPYMNAVIFR